MSRFLWILLLSWCGVLSAWPRDTESGIREISAYLSESGEDLLKVYNPNGTWSNFKDVGQRGNVYVLSHGIGDTYDTGWIRDTANAILAKDENAQILSVNWDKYSNAITKTSTDANGNVSYSSVFPNATASMWINSISQMVSDELASKGVSNVKSAIGHSYGAHILAGSISDSDTTVTKFNRLVALDPAEESLTFTGDQNGNVTSMFSSDKKSKNWGISGKTTVEVYKSSSFLGNDIPLGDYNYIIAQTDTFLPRSVLGDWGGFNMPAGAKGKHALATHWISAQIDKSSSTEIGGWFNNQTVLGEGSGKWHGLVNTDSCQMEYAMKTSQASWGDAVFEYACTTDDWSGTILNSGYQTKFQEQYSSGEGVLDSLSLTKELYNTEAATAIGSTNSFTSLVASSEEAVNGNTTAGFATSENGAANGANGTAATIATVVDATYNGVKDVLNMENFAGWCDKTVTSLINTGKDKLVTTATTAVDGLLDKLNVGYGTDVAVDIVKKGANELISNSGSTIASAVQNFYNDLRKDFSVDTAIESIKNNVKTATSELWAKGKETLTSTFKNLFSWNTLETVIGKGLDALLEKNPTLKTIFSAFGLKDGKSIVNIGKELFTAVKGLLSGKSLIEVLKDSQALQNVIKNGIKSGINYLVNKFLTPLVNKAITKVSGWLNNLLGNKLGISITETEISTMLTSAYNEGVKLAEKDISDFIDTKASAILGTNSTDNTTTTSSGNNNGNTTIFERPKQGEEIKKK